jgi:hypothetical protein
VVLEILAATQLALEALVNNGQMVLSMAAAVRVRVVILIILALEEQAAVAVGRAVLPVLQTLAAAVQGEMTPESMAATVVLVL